MLLLPCQLSYILQLWIKMIFLVANFRIFVTKSASFWLWSRIWPPILMSNVGHLIRLFTFFSMMKTTPDWYYEHWALPLLVTHIHTVKVQRDSLHRTLSEQKPTSAHCGRYQLEEHSLHRQSSVACPPLLCDNEICDTVSDKQMTQRLANRPSVSSRRTLL